MKHTITSIERKLSLFGGIFIFVFYLLDLLNIVTSGYPKWLTILGIIFGGIFIWISQP